MAPKHLCGGFMGPGMLEVWPHKREGEIHIENIIYSLPQDPEERTSLLSRLLMIEGIEPEEIQQEIERLEKGYQNSLKLAKPQ